MASLDSYINEPSGKRDYLMNYGYHFSKKAYQWAVSMMKKKDANGKLTDIQPKTMDEVDDMLRKNNVKLKNNKGYDAAYLASLVMADMWGSSIEDEAHLAKYLKDTLDDVDGGEEKVFRHWYSDMIEKGIPILWEEIM